MRDVIVVGARAAGAATALLLARAGLDVLVVDRAPLGADIPHGHFIHRHGPVRLAAWGLLDDVLAAGTPAVTAITQDFGDFALTGTDLQLDGIPVGLGPRRSRLDRLLVEAAVAAGADHRERFGVTELLWDGDRVCGVRGPLAERARVVVGADGRNSPVARWVGAPVTREVPTQSCWYFSYFSGVRATGLDLLARPGTAIFAHPTDDGLFAVFVSRPIGELKRVRADIEGSFWAALEPFEDLAVRVREGRREERFYGAAQLPNVMRRPWGPGWALAGDAGCHTDPYLALGMCDAFRDADLLSAALVDGLGGARPLEAALAGYEAARDEATLPDFQLNVELARLGPQPPFITEMRARCRGSAEAARQFFLVGERRLPMPAGVPV
jgi:2-polyprenyl-6-methoxyphenol hydroxylase-like FAD-dependent oxidoreductase